MAFPTTLSTLVEPWHGVGGPFVAPNGAVYVVTRDSTGGSLHMFKATDPSSSWSGAGTDLAMASGNTIRALDAYQFENYIHVVTRDAADSTSNQIRHHAFNTNTDNWDAANILVRGTFTQKSFADQSGVNIGVRSANSIIVAYEGPQVLADIQRSRAVYARYLGVGWSADIALDNGGNVDWYPQELIVGSGGRIHFIIFDNVNFDLYQRTLNSANALESFPAAFDTDLPAQPDTGYQRGVAYSASAGGTVVRYAYFDNYNPEIADIRFTSADAPSPITQTTNITNPAIPEAGGTVRRTCGLAVDGNTVYHVFVNDTSDIYIQSSQDAGSWSSPTLLLDATDAGYIYPNRYVRGTNRVVGVVYQDTSAGGAAVKYTEYTLGTSVVTGRLSATDVVDRFSASAFNRVAGVIAFTQASDTFSASGTALPLFTTGRLSATDAADRLSASGYVIVSGLVSATDAQDRLSASGTLGLLGLSAIHGSISYTTVKDTAAGSGYVLVRGRLSATETGDRFTASGAGALLLVRTGVIAWTMAPDIFSAPRANPSLGVDPGTSNAGGGAGRSNKANIPVPVDLWDAREAYLQSLFPDQPVPDVEADNASEWAAYEARKQEIERLTSERSSVILELRNAPDVASMKRYGAQIKELTARIATLTGKQQFVRFMQH